MTGKRYLAAAVALMFAVAFVPGCQRGGGGGTTGGQQEKVGPVQVMGVWGGTELENFTKVSQGWEQETGGTMNFEGTRDLSAILRARVSGGNPPDVAILPNPALLQQYSSNMAPLDDVVDMNQLRNDYGQTWIDQGSVNGKLYGIFIKASPKSTVWYNPKEFQSGNYQVPQTWDELDTLAAKMKSDGKTPWSLGLEAGGASGWPGSDWIQEIYLNENGPEKYDQWTNHEIPWTDPTIKAAFERFGASVLKDGYVKGGKDAILSTNFEDASFPPFEKEPKAEMYFLGSFAQGFIEAQFPDLKPVDDFDFFHTPTINQQYAGSVTGGGDIAVMFNDTPSARSFMQYLATADSWKPWAEAGGFTTPNKSFDASSYPDPLTQKAAQQLTESANFRFDADDLMPAELQNAYWSGILDYVENPDRLDSILANIEKVATDAYAAREKEQQAPPSGEATGSSTETTTTQ